MAETLAQLLAADPIRNGLYTSLQAIDAAFHIEPYLRIVTHRASAESTYINPDTDKLDIFMIEFKGIFEGQTGTVHHNLGNFDWVYAVHYFRGLQDDEFSEVAFTNTLKDVVKGLAADTKLGGAVAYSEVIAIEDTVLTLLGNDAAHHAEMLVTVHEQSAP